MEAAAGYTDCEAHRDVGKQGHHVKGDQHLTRFQSLGADEVCKLCGVAYMGVCCSYQGGQDRDKVFGQLVGWGGHKQHDRLEWYVWLVYFG